MISEIVGNIIEPGDDDDISGRPNDAYLLSTLS